MTNVCILGSSLGWTPYLLPDLIDVFKDGLEIRLIDIDPRPAKLCAEWGERANKHFNRRDRYIPFTDRRTALKGADAVIITLSTGGLDAMAFDLAIPEKYGVFATVGDTAGPGGWSRAVRNIPVFRAFADDFAELCPSAFIANYTNPMAALTATLQRCCPNPSVGLCHAYFETKDVIQKVFGLPDWKQIAVAIAGMNHFTWVVEFKIGRDDGYTLLRRKLAGRSLADALPRESADDIGIFSGHRLCVELFDTFGYLPYPGDRHTCEFVSFAITGHPERFTRKNDRGQDVDTFRYCDLRRTSIDHRRDFNNERETKMQAWLRGEKPLPGRSRETGAEMIRAYLENRPFTDAVNALNAGQIPGLPLGACVETLGTTDGLGVRPLLVPHVPEHLLELLRPHAFIQKWVVDGMLNNDKDLLLQALYRDPQCAHLKPHEVRALAADLLEANRQFLETTPFA